MTTLAQAVAANSTLVSGSLSEHLQHQQASGVVILQGLAGEIDSQLTGVFQSQFKSSISPSLRAEFHDAALVGGLVQSLTAVLNE